MKHIFALLLVLVAVVASVRINVIPHPPPPPSTGTTTSPPTSQPPTTSPTSPTTRSPTTGNTPTSNNPTSSNPTSTAPPTSTPSSDPTTSAPSPAPTSGPTSAPTSGPTSGPTSAPTTSNPTTAPTTGPTTSNTTQPGPSPSPSPSPSPAGQGADVSDPVSASQASCLKSYISYAVVRCWHSNGVPDTAAPGSLSAFQGAGISADVYMFPCYSCGNPSGQVAKAVAALKQAGSTWGRFWLDIEGPGQYWSNSQSANQQFFAGLLQGAQSAGLNVGIYTSASQWVPIFGSSYSAGSSYPLWYANYDGAQNFNDFSPFGGWSTPTIKQYDDNGNECGVGYDKDWAPGN